MAVVDVTDPTLDPPAKGNPNVDDTLAFQNALDVLRVRYNNGYRDSRLRLYVPPGDYRLSTPGEQGSYFHKVKGTDWPVNFFPILHANFPVLLDFAPGAHLRLELPNALQVPMGNKARKQVPAILITADGVTVTGGTISGQGPAWCPAAKEPKTAELMAWETYGVVLKGFASDVKIDGVTVTGMCRDGILVESGTLTDQKKRATSFYDRGLREGAWDDRPTVELANCTTSFCGRAGIMIWSGEDIVIDQCRVYGCGSGTYFEGSEEKDFKVIGGICVEPQGDAFVKRLRISGSSVIGCGRGIRLTGGPMAGFKIPISDLKAEYGFQDPRLQDVVVSNCSAANNENAGIYVQRAHHWLIQDCDCIGNKDEAGVQVWSSDATRGVIQRVKALGNKEGISVGRSAILYDGKPPVKDAAGNNVFLPPTQQYIAIRDCYCAANSASGIWCAIPIDLVIDGNHSVSNNGDGIKITGESNDDYRSDKIMIVNNTCDSNGGSGIRLHRLRDQPGLTEELTIVGNTSSNNKGYGLEATVCDDRPVGFSWLPGNQAGTHVGVKVPPVGLLPFPTP